ncbi:class I SAM-dependent methyltransferase [Pseudonocardia alaniniphila]|uniref:Methyltransferase domain-containing protein n=1 Tax=Pseudonocardia alaniniphila TaxID=75291 RepID=A0ABS9T921_9PSEU|nr:methyltransferase domain-containing protein [Pseudonocardia alaniniphila]MCH6164796.1 methyltransferase domain-containing protein [Pseudonocardia alaniniphila]
MSDIATASAAAFDAAADTYDEDRHHVEIAEELVRGLQPTSPPALVVDVATGTGFAAFAALRRLAARRVVGIDISQGMLDRARAKAADEDPGGRIEWRHAPAMPLDLVTGSADVVLCASALHLLGREALREWLRVLRPGGQVVFSVPMAEDFHPSPEFRRMVESHLSVPRDATEAAGLAHEAGFAEARAEVLLPASERPRRVFIVRAQAPL